VIVHLQDAIVFTVLIVVVGEDQRGIRAAGGVARVRQKVLEQVLTDLAAGPTTLLEGDRYIVIGILIC
jgi:hypothetical protein